jgi:hypothetical protein
MSNRTSPSKRTFLTTQTPRGESSLTEQQLQEQLLRDIEEEEQLEQMRLKEAAQRIETLRKKREQYEAMLYRKQAPASPSEPSVLPVVVQEEVLSEPVISEADALLNAEESKTFLRESGVVEALQFALRSIVEVGQAGDRVHPTPLEHAARAIEMFGRNYDKTNQS